MKKISIGKSIIEILDTSDRYSRDSIEKQMQDKIDKEGLGKETVASIFEEYGNALHSLNNSTSHSMVLTLFEEKYRPMLLEMVQGIIKDYQCKNVLEITLAQNIAIAYGRAMVLQSRVNAYLLGEGLLSTLRNTRLQILSTELDRANRQYLMFIKTLTELRRPQLKVNVKIDSMVVGNNYVYPKNKLYD